MEKTTKRADVELTHSPHTDSILMGPCVATFKTEDYTGDVSAAGKILRVHVNGVDGYVDIDIRQAVAEAIGMLTDGNFESFLLTN